MRDSAPDFKTYIFGIVLQFLTIGLKKMLGIFFLDWTGLLDPCVWYQMPVEARNIREQEWRVAGGLSFAGSWFGLVWFCLD